MIGDDDSFLEVDNVETCGYEDLISEAQSADSLTHEPQVGWFTRVFSYISTFGRNWNPFSTFPSNDSTISAPSSSVESIHSASSPSLEMANSTASTAPTRKSVHFGPTVNIRMTYKLEHPFAGWNLWVGKNLPLKTFMGFTLSNEFVDTSMDFEEHVAIQQSRMKPLKQWSRKEIYEWFVARGCPEPIYVE